MSQLRGVSKPCSINQYIIRRVLNFLALLFSANTAVIISLLFNNNTIPQLHENAEVIGLLRVMCGAESSRQYYLLCAMVSLHHSIVLKVEGQEELSLDYNEHMCIMRGEGNGSIY